MHCDQDEQEEGDEEEKSKKKKRMTKSDLYKAYSGRGPIRMFSDLIMDRQLQLAAICICEISKPLEDFYAKSLKAQKETALVWATTRAWAEAGSWWDTCTEILQCPQEIVCCEGQTYNIIN